MSSRRPMTRSYSEGRSSSHNGDDVSGTSRTSSCSYLSSVRPENSQSSHRYSQYRPSRSTLFSVMAHLIEETQPLFETTLKSRAVSETSNVKFTCVVSGYPAPEVTWYKDDTQLDRYCGLPKYKVCRDGMDHSLYIYNCTEEDAAIYQASAKNSKGIVSCSGVLEVGTMSEYKIHQQYFAKLKQKAENKRRALEESKENHGPGPQEELRTISPERSQRKRRSPMETSLSAPSSMEDEVAEVNTPALVPAAEARLQQTVMDGEDKPVPTTNGAAPHIPNGQDIKENGRKGTYVYDSTQKTFVAHPPKAPFAKKKIKISNGVESVKGDSLAEMASEERGTSGGASAAHCQTDSLHTQGSVDEVMEVESSAPDPVKEAEQEEKASNVGVSVGIEKVQMEGKLHAPSHKEHPLDLSATPHVPSPTKDISGTKRENGVEREKALEVEPKNIVGCQVVNLAISSQSKPSSSIANTVEIKSYPEDVTVMEVEVKPLAPELAQKPSALGSMKRTSTLVNKAKVAVKDSATVGALSSDVSINGSTLSRAAESTATPRDRETVLPQRLRACEQSGDQLSGKETSSSTKNVCVSALQGEVTQADTQTGRNDAPVDLKPLATRSELDVPLPQRPSRERGAMTDADQTPTLHSASQPASDDMTHATWDHSRGSNESHTVPSTELLKSPLESPGDSDNKSGCSVSPTLQQGQVEIAIKTVVGTEIPVDKNVQGNEIGEQQVQIGNFASVGRKIDIDTEVGSLNRIHQDDIKIIDAAEKKKIEINKVLDVKMEKNGQVVLKTLPLNPNLEAVKDKSQIAATTSVQNLNISAQETQDFNVVPTSSPVMSIAEILRAQIKALASTVSSSATPVQPMHVPNQHVDHRPSPAKLTEIQSSGQASEMRMEETDYSKDSGKPKLEKDIDTNIGSISNVVLRLDNVEPHSCTESKLLQSSNVVSPAVETLPNTFVIPPISIIDIENTFKNRTPIIVKDNESVMDTGQEYGTSLCAPLENSPYSLTGKNSVDSSLITTSTLPVKISQEHTQVQGNTTEEMDSSWSVPLKVSSQHNIVSLPQESSKTISSLPCDRKNHSLTQRPEFPLNRTPTVPLVTEVKNAQPDSAMLLEPLEEHTRVVPQRNSQIMLDTQAALDTETPDVPAPINQLDRSTSSEIKVEDYSKTDPLIPASNTDESPLLRKKENTSPIPSATPQELALGARRKIFLPKPRGEETEATPPADSQPQREEVLKKGSRLSPEKPSMSPSLSRKTALLQPPSGQSTPPAERRSPLLGRRKVAAGAPEQIQKPALSTEITRTEQKPALSTEITRTEQKPALSTEITRTEQKPALSTEITRTEQKPALEITRTEQKPALEITRTEQKPALSTEITRTEQKPALEITRTEQKPTEITRTEQKPALGTEITRTEQKHALEITRTEQKAALTTEITRTEQKAALEITRTEQKAALEITRTEQKPALEITRTEQKAALEITRTEQKSALEITRTEQKPALSTEITRTEQKPALSTEITRTEQKPTEITRTEQKAALEITRTEQKPALEITRTEQKPALEITRTEQKPALSTEITRTEQKPALGTEITRTEQKPALEITRTEQKPALEITRTEQKPALGTDITRTEQKPALEITRTEQKPALEITRTEQKPALGTEITRTEQKPALEITRTEQKPALEITRTEQKPALEITRTEQKPALGTEITRTDQKPALEITRTEQKPALEITRTEQKPALGTDITRTEPKPDDKDKHKQFKAPQVIRKIRAELFSDASGHLKLWCQFFNVLSDSTVKWYRDEVEISEVKKSAEDETQVALAIVQPSSRDCGVYGCTITNEYGTDSTDFLLSVDILRSMFLREEPAVGEEIEMTPLLFNKGVADSGLWGNKLFGRIMMMESHVGEGCSHKACRVKVIYGLEPLFESGSSSVIKVRSPIAYGGKGESSLVERNLEITQLDCRLQNIAREYCKIFAAETRVIENFGPTLEVIPLYLMYRPANAVPHATVEAALQGVYLSYCLLDASGSLVMRTGSEVEQKCCALQHWIHQWTNGNLLLTRLEGVDTKITNVGMSIKSKGYQGLTPTGNPRVFEQFISQHQCNYYCGLLKLRTMKPMDSLTPAKPKGSRSPLLQRKTAAGSSSPQTSRRATTSPRVSRKSESEDSKATSTQKGGEAPKSDG